MAAKGVEVRAMSRPRDVQFDTLSSALLNLSTAAWHLVGTSAEIMDAKRANATLKLAKALRLSLAASEFTVAADLLQDLDMMIAGGDHPLTMAMLGRVKRIASALEFQAKAPERTEQARQDAIEAENHRREREGVSSRAIRFARENPQKVVELEKRLAARKRPESGEAGRSESTG